MGGGQRVRENVEGAGVLPASDTVRNHILEVFPAWRSRKNSSLSFKGFA